MQLLSLKFHNESDEVHEFNFLKIWNIVLSYFQMKLSFQETPNKKRITEENSTITWLVISKWSNFVIKELITLVAISFGSLHFSENWWKRKSRGQTEILFHTCLRLGLIFFYGSWEIGRFLRPPFPLT